MPGKRNKRATAVIGICAVVVGITALFQIRTFDTMFHLAAGRQILDTWTIPAQDTFSFTFRGAIWHNHSPLFQLVIAAIHRFWGYEGLSLFQWLMSTLLVMLAAQSAIRSGTSLGMATVLAALPVLLFHDIIVPRPHVFGFLLFQIVLSVILSAEQPDGRLLRLCLLPVIYLGWLGSHGSNIIQLIMMAICWVGSLLRKRRNFAFLYGASLAVCVAELLILKPSALLLAEDHVASSFLIAEIPEWSSLSPALLFGGKTGMTLVILLMLTLAGMIIRSGVMKIEGVVVATNERLLPHHGVMLLGVMLLSLTSVRMAPLFLLGAGPLWIPCAGKTVSLLIERVARFVPQGHLAWMNLPYFRDPGIVALLSGAVIICLIGDRKVVFGVGIEQKRFPQAAVAALDHTGLGQRVYNAYNWGGYLMFERQNASDGVFVDGRAITLYPADFLETFTAAYDRPRLFEQLVQTYRVDAVLMPVKSWRTRTLLGYLETHRRWTRFFADEVAVVYVRSNLPRRRRER